MRTVRIAGWILLLIGLLLCISVDWAAVGFLSMGFGLIALQIILGFARVISVHVPLGVATILLAILLAVWAWRRR